MRYLIRNAAAAFIALFLINCQLGFSQDTPRVTRSLYGIYSSLDYGGLANALGRHPDYEPNGDDTRDRLGGTAGVHFLTDFNSQLTLGYGISVSDKSYKYFSPWWSLIGPRPISQIIYLQEFFVELPITIDYTFVKKTNSSFGGGISPDVIFGYIDKFYGLYDDGTTRNRRYVGTRLGPFSLMGIVESGFRFKMSNKLSGRLSLNARRTLIAREYFFTYYSVGLGAGVYHSF